MKPKLLRDLIKHSKNLFPKDEQVEKTNLVNLHELINDYHYKFYSHKNYKVCYKRVVYIFFCLGMAIFSIIIYLYFAFFEKTTTPPHILNFILYVVSMVGFVIGIVNNQNLVNRQIIFNYKNYLNKEELKTYYQTRHDFAFTFTQKKLLKKVIVTWLDEKIYKHNFLTVAESVSKTERLLKLHIINQGAVVDKD